MVLTALLSSPSSAQYLAPAVTPQIDADSALSARSSARDTRESNGGPRRAIRTALGGILGGAAGTAAGMLIAAEATSGCHGEFCGLGQIVLGMSLGESIGLATGANIASGSHKPEHIVLTTLSSAGILIGGAFAAAGLNGLNGNAGSIMIPLIPALQLAAAIAIENH
jgi:hypothetical protein